MSFLEDNLKIKAGRFGLSDIVGSIPDITPEPAIEISNLINKSNTKSVSSVSSFFDERYNPPARKVKRFATNIPGENFIMKFLDIASNVGFQSSNQYIALIQGPAPTFSFAYNGFNSQLSETITSQNELLGDSGKAFKRNANERINPLSMELKKRLSLMCCNCNLPGKNINTHDYAMSSGPFRKMPYLENFSNDIVMEFYAGTDMFERLYFSSWQRLVVDPVSHSFGLYDEYAKPWSIVIAVLPRFAGRFDQLSTLIPQENGSNSKISLRAYDTQSSEVIEDVYFVQLNECYPVEITEVPLAYDNSGIAKIRVRFAYRNWVDPYLKAFTAYKANVENGVDAEDKTLDSLTLFKLVVKDIIRYANPKELKQLAVDKSLGYLNSAFGIETVEKVAQAGQVVDVYRQTPNKEGWTTLYDRVIAPFGRIL